MIYANELNHNVIRLTVVIDNVAVGVGTGFVYSLAEDGAQHSPILVTNRHVVEGASEIQFLLSETDKDSKPVSGKYVPVSIPTSRWSVHPDKDIDLAAVNLSPYILKIRAGNASPRYTRITPDLIPEGDELMAITPGQDVVMVGYPTGLWDESNNRPIFRKGITATQPGLNYNGRSEFLIDIAAINGSSGSPVFIYEDPLITHAKDGSEILLRKPKIRCIGILWGGPVYSAEGKVVSKESPTRSEELVTVGIPINLGYVLSSLLLKDFAFLRRS